MPDRHGRVRQLVDGKIVRRVAPELRQRTYTYGPPIERVKARITIDSNGCWIWNGAKTSGGYGHVKTGLTTYKHAHVVTYEDKYGPVTEGLELDHLCRVRACCNPDHLEAVTHTENVRRGGAMVRKCAHPDSEFYRRKSNGRIVYCRTCRRKRRAA